MTSDFPLVYLASPYSHPDPGVRAERFRQVVIKAAHLMDEGWNIFCPIAHTHPMVEHTSVLADKPGSWWLEQDYQILKHCKMLFVYMIPGYKESVGVAHEVEFAVKHGIPVAYLEYDPELEKGI